MIRLCYVTDSRCDEVAIPVCIFTLSFNVVLHNDAIEKI